MLKEGNSELMEIQQAKPSPSAFWLFYLLCALIFTAILWSHFSTVNVIVKGNGVLHSVEGYQHTLSPFTGIVDSVLVKENQHVQKGDSLLVFNTKDINAEISQNEEAQKRIIYEMKDLDQLLRKTNENGLFIVTKYKSEHEVLMRHLDLMDAEIAIEEKDLSRNKILYQRKLISQEEYEKNGSELERLRVQKAQYVQEQDLKFYSEKNILEKELLKLKKDKIVFEDLKRKRVITANTDGHVLQLNVKNSGTYVYIGQELLCISPDSNLIAELFVHTKDIALLKEGLNVIFQLESLPYQEWGMAKGKIVMISDDIVLNNPSGDKAYFKVIASFDNNTLSSKRIRRNVKIRKGMVLEARIVIGKKRILEYFFDKTIDFFSIM